MAEVSGHSDAPPEAVFAVLADGWLYTNWVVGTSHMRAVESAWPAPGSRLHHSSGIWPLVTRDETVVEACEPGHRLQLKAKGGVLGAARVVLTVEPDGSGTRITLAETPVDGPGKWLHNPLNEAVLVRRNTETVARLVALAERRTEPVER